MNKALDFAGNYTKISKEDIRLIYHCRKSLLFFNDEAWKKKDTDSSFDLTMGSFDGAELCELIGIYIQSLLTDSIELITTENIGLYRDDGLILLRYINRQQTDRLRKRVIKKFQSIGFKIEIVTNLQEVDFLDLTFNLISNTYHPYKKPNDNLTYIKHHQTTHQISSNSSLKPSVSGYPEILQVLKFSTVPNLNTKML